MREQYYLARVTPDLIAIRKNVSTFRRGAGRVQGASVDVARGAGDTDTMKWAAKPGQPLVRMTTYERDDWPHVSRLGKRRSTWLFVTLICVAAIAVWAGAAVLLSLELAFEPAVLLR